jgi:hypothetical protein
MSAYVVSDNHINELMRFIDSRFFLSMGYIQRLMPETYSLSGEKLYQAIGQELLKENYLSVNRRYKESDKVHKFDYFPKLGNGNLKPVEILKLVKCLEYQSCEHEEWENSVANKILKTITCNAIERLDGYDEASWGVN